MEDKVSTIRVHGPVKERIEESMKPRESYEDCIFRVFSTQKIMENQDQRSK